MVQAKSLSPNLLIEAMEAGEFYASTGVSLNSLEQTNGKIKIEIKSEADINYTIHFIGVRKGSLVSEIFESVEGNIASFEMTNDMLFVRARVVSTKIKENPFQEGDFEMAWTQPVTH